MASLRTLAECITYYFYLFVELKFPVMLKRLFLSVVLFSLSTYVAFSQVIKPISWDYKLTPSQYKVGDTVTLHFEAKIDKAWYLYSNDFDPDLGPMLTTFSFQKDDSYQRIDSVKAMHPKKKYDDIWGGSYTYFKGEGHFEQKVLVKKLPLNIQGSMSYQVCSEENGQCIPFDDDFNFTPSNSKAESAHTSETKVKQAAEKSSTTPKKEGLLKQRTSHDPYTLWGFMIAAFLGGLAALLTPCVFPLIPMTVTFFTGNKGSRRKGVMKALGYGLSIVLIYVIAGTIVAAINGPAFANWLSTHWLPNTFFFLVFFLFALSFLGWFEITLPSRFVNNVDKQADKGGIWGIFFMAFTLVLVSFSCTGPIVGSILVESAGGQIIKPILGMLSFSLALAIPFTLFAIFPEWLKGLPKSGGWLNSVKVVLGFLELALGLKFLSVADQVYHWGILDREIYLALWIVIFSMLGLYLLGKLKLPNDSSSEKTSVPRLVLAIITFSFVVYLIPGMWGAPLKALAGYLPPMSTHDFNISAIVRENATGGGSAPKSNELCETPKFEEFLDLPLGLEGYFDYDQAIACARKQNKPLFIDFTGHGCVNCREMEARVWSDPEVLKILKNDYVVVALYVDDKKELPKEDWYTSPYDQKEKKTIGAQNADFQIRKFNNNAQPFYVLMDGQETVLEDPIGYEPSVEKFKAYLLKGLEDYKKSHP